MKIGFRQPDERRHGRRRAILTAAIAISVVSFAVTGTVSAQPTTTFSCDEAGAIAERAWGLPEGMLNAIGKVESGLSVGGTVTAWPWTINAAGRGQHFASKESAQQTVMQLQAQGMRSIDVGCFQINLMHHARAFVSLDQAFDPLSNADYAARFLTDLQARTGSWESAIGAYHSASPELGQAYRGRVFAAWRSVARGSAPQPMPPVAELPPGITTTPASLTTVSVSPQPAAVNGAKVWTVARQSMGMRIWTATPAHRQQFAAMPAGDAGPRPIR